MHTATLKSSHRAFLDNSGITIAIGWLMFLAGTFSYCLSWAILVEQGTFSGRFMDALICVKKDWLIWICLTPILWSKLKDNPNCLQDPSQRNTTLRLLFGLIILAATTRVGIESVIGDMSFLQVIMLYLPRYAAVAVFVSIALLYYLKTNEPQSDKAYSSKISVSKGNVKLQIAIGDIISIKSAGNYLELHTPQSTFLTRMTFKSFFDTVDPGAFIRVHRSYAVSKKAINGVDFANKQVVLDEGKRVPLSRNYHSQLAHFR